jgi:hypothetical protein
MCFPQRISFLRLWKIINSNFRFDIDEDNRYTFGKIQISYTTYKIQQLTCSNINSFGNFVENTAKTFLINITF